LEEKEKQEEIEDIKEEQENLGDINIYIKFNNIIYI
jgi:hypothetical protein